jgi:hypothetical protein
MIGIFAFHDRSVPMAERMSESQLIEAMRDPRYWSPNHPERTEFIDRITKGWEELYPSKEQSNTSNGIVHVREHTRRVDGTIVNVDAYDRSAVGRNTSQIGNSIGLPKNLDDHIEEINWREITCNAQLNRDFARCASPSVHPAWKRTCRGSAMDRYSQCLVGRPIQQLFLGH